LLREVKDLYKENYITMIHKIKNTHTNRKTSHAHGLEQMILLNVYIYKVIYRFDAIPTQMTMTFFIELEKHHHKTHMEA
jgi:hypothetical protein